jgi:predicted nucleic acid-binding protein
MIAAISSWHEHHERARLEIENRLSHKQQMVVAGPTLIEAYSVLTRFPAPHRIAPADARNLLESNFLQGVKIVALGAAAYAALLRGAPSADISGGQTYDAVIAACARKAKVNALLTFNDVHFAPFAGDGLEIIVP